MKNYRIFEAALTRKWLNFTEYLAYAILYRKPFDGLTLEKDLKYSSGSDKEIVDFIYPEAKSDEKRPIMIYIHGGGWLSGVKNMRRTYCYEYAKQGYFVANVDYDYAPGKQFPSQVQQCLNAVDFILDNADKYNMDTNRILLAGESAGAYFVAMLAAIAKNKELLKTLGLTLRHTEFDVTVNLFNCGAFDVKSCASSKFPLMGIMVESFTNLSREQILSGEYDEVIDKMNPVNYIASDFPPTYMLYATRDALRVDSFSLKKRLDYLHVDNELYKCDGPLFGNHAFAVATVVEGGQVILRATQAFINRYIFEEKSKAVKMPDIAKEVMNG